MIIEICANSYQSAINSEVSGAHRIELCTELPIGGITPSFGLIKQVISKLNIPVFVLIRPRSGNFTYSEDEFEIMKQDILLCKDLGCHGIVSGVLNGNTTVDTIRTKELVELSKPLPFTFHRAFDCVPKSFDALEELINLGVNRILTSGQETSAEKGLDQLKKLNEVSDGRIIILVGGGITAENAINFKETGFSEIHASASSKLKVDNSLFSEPLTYSDSEKIKALLDAL